MTARLQVTGVRLVFCIAACALSFPVCAHYHFLSTETDAYRVELINWERHGEGYSEVRFVLLITDRTTGKEQRVEIDNRLTGIERLDIAQGMLLAYGDVGGHFEGLTLVRLANAEVTDFILSYGSDLSPARRYLVFRKFYPPRGMTATRSDVVLVYDLAQERSENWLPGAPGVPAGKNVGLPVYPHENVDPVTYRVWVAEECQRHYVDPQAGFLWTRDEKSLFFIDKTRGQQLLVRVDLEEGLKRPRITTRTIDPTLALAIDSQALEISPEGERKNLAVTGMDFEPDGRIRLELDRELFERKIYRVTHMSVAPPETASPIKRLAEEP